MKLAACLIVKNEEKLILEWIAYHSIIGFDTLIILDDHSTDKTYDLIAHAAKSLDIRLMTYNQTEKGKQAATYGTICKLFAREFHRILFIDADEFVLPARGGSIKDLPVIASDSTAIAIPWLMFGSSGHDICPPGLILENFIKRSEYSFGPNRHIKSIVRPDSVTNGINPHFFEIGEPYVNCDGSRVVWEQDGLLQTYPENSELFVNHYFTRARSNWQARMQRGQLGNIQRSWNDFDSYDQNQVTDTRACRYADQVRALIDKISSR